MSKNDFIGEAAVPIRDIVKMDSYGYKDWVPIHYKGKESGKVFIEAHYLGGSKKPAGVP